MTLGNRDGKFFFRCLGGQITVKLIMKSKFEIHISETLGLLVYLFGIVFYPLLIIKGDELHQ